MTAPAPEIHEPRAHPLARYFGEIRRTRREHYAARPRPVPGRNRRAVQTIVHDEGVFLPIWLRYYSRFFAPEDIYVLDNDTTDGSTDRDGFVRIPVSHDRVDHVWMVEKLAGHQRELLERYDVVVTTDVDEIVATDPRWGTLGDYLDRFDEEWVNCLGYELLHLPDREPALSPDRPVLEQRGHWFASNGYDKPAIASAPTEWVPGFHERADGRVNFDPDLRMIHLHRMDYEICRARHEKRSRRAWNGVDVEQGWAAHNRIAGGEDFDRWYYRSAGTAASEIVLERIPPVWRSVV